jgi:hypothetical protein
MPGGGNVAIRISAQLRDERAVCAVPMTLFVVCDYHIAASLDWPPSWCAAEDASGDSIIRCLGQKLV